MTIFDKISDVSDKNIKTNLKFLFHVTAVSFLVITTIGIIARINELELGTLGDFIGGILNPVLTFITFVGLLITILIQQAELRESRIEFSRSATALETQNATTEKQNFESTFFQMVNLLNGQLNNLTVRTKSGSIFQARDALREIYANLKWQYENDRNREDDNTRIKNSVNLILDEFGPVLHPFYNTLSTIIEYIDRSEVDDKAIYMKITLSQLSDYDKLLIFYLSKSTNGSNRHDYEKKYALFRELPLSKFLNSTHLPN